MTEPRKVLIVAPGSRGDFGPYHGLGVRLREAGHQVLLAAYAHHRDMVEKFDMDFFPLAGDAHALQGEEEMARWQESGSGMRSAAQGVRIVKTVAGEVRSHAEEMMAAARQGVDVMIPSILASVGFLVAEGLRIPAVEAYLGPTEPTGDFPPPGIGLGRSLGRLGNRTMYGLVRAVVNSASKDSIAELRADLGLPPPVKADNSRREIHYGYSPQVSPAPKDWPAGARVVGYWWPAPALNWQPPAGLTDFLAAGPPPVFVTFGSMNGEDRGRLLSEIILGALRQAGVRAVIQAGYAGLSAHGDDVLCVDGEIDYQWFLPRCAAVVHHGGAGTTGAVVRSGVPQVVVPMIADSHFWARRVTAIGVSPGPVPFKKISVDRLGGAIRAAVTDPAYRRRAGAVAARVAEEDGAAQVVDAVNRIS